MKDYYSILGVSPNSSEKEIKSAYRKLSLKFHPDKNNGDKFFEEKFIELNEAYQVIGNSEKRQEYDRTKDSSSKPFESNKNIRPSITLFEVDSMNKSVGEYLIVKWIVNNCDRVELTPVGIVKNTGHIRIKITENLGENIVLKLKAWNNGKYVHRIHKIEITRVSLQPHSYPLWIKITFSFLTVLLIYTLTLLPKIFTLKSELNQSVYYFSKADSLYDLGEIDSAIKLYRKGHYLNWKKEPFNLAICYLSLKDKYSLQYGLALLKGIDMNQSEFESLITLLPSELHSYVYRWELQSKRKINSQLIYKFNFTKLKKENILLYKQVSEKRKEYEKFINSNPNR
ncbi:MAG: DnaJ domain-containing protein [Spirosomaceae bacterium]|nr:DnaJ domain-containing protein [Spirosomataceae bacterium]